MSGEGNLAAQAALLQIIGSEAPNAKVAFGRHTTAAAVDTVETGLSKVKAVILTCESDASLAGFMFTAVPSLTGSSFSLKSWKATAAADCTPIAATAFSKIVNWVAIGE